MRLHWGWVSWAHPPRGAERASRSDAGGSLRVRHPAKVAPCSAWTSQQPFPGRFVVYRRRRWWSVATVGWWACRGRESGRVLRRRRRVSTGSRDCFVYTAMLTCSAGKTLAPALQQLLLELLNSVCVLLVSLLRQCAHALQELVDLFGIGHGAGETGQFESLPCRGQETQIKQTKGEQRHSDNPRRGGRS